MGAVRRFPSLTKRPKIEKPCVPASRHDWRAVQRNPVRSIVEGDYIVLHRCLHCANSIYVQTKRYTLKKPPLPLKRRKVRET